MFENVLISPSSVINLSLAVAIIVIGLSVYFKRRNNFSASVFLVVCINVTFWVFTSTMADVSTIVDSAYIWSQLAIIGPFFGTAFFLMLSYQFPIRLKKLGMVDAFIILLPSLLAVPLSASRLNIQSVNITQWGTDFEPGHLYTALLVYMIVYYFLAARNFYLAWKKDSDLIIRRQIIFVFVGMISMVTIGAITNLVLPLVLQDAKASVFGPAGAIFFVVFLAHAIVRYQMLDLRVVAAELFTFVLIIINFVEMLMAEGVVRFSLRAFLFVISAATGIMLIRSVTAEIKRRQEMQQLALKLDKMNQDLRRLDDLKSEFISIASHQLRTPVSVIKGYLSLIKDGAFGKVDGELKEKLEQIYDMNERLVHLINNLLNISRIEKGAIQFWCSETNPTDIIRRVINEMSFKLRSKDLKLTLTEPDVPVPDVFIDPERLTEVVINLVDNAIKYTHQGEITVTLSNEAPEKPVVVHVSDTGIGMNLEDMQHVFQKFYRPRRPSAEHKAGLSMGLGLYICAKFLRSMGGDIWVEHTAPGEGTVIGFALPTVASGVCDSDIPLGQKVPEDSGDDAPEGPETKK